MKKFGLDDLFMLIAIVSRVIASKKSNSLTKPETLGLGQTATIVLQVQHGRGQHTIDLEEEHFDHMLMVIFSPSIDTTSN